MIEQGDGHIPRRQIHWVERPIGERKRRVALSRWRSSHQFFSRVLPNWTANIEDCSSWCSLRITSLAFTATKKTAPAVFHIAITLRILR